jgi:hypothetical protein
MGEVYSKKGYKSSQHIGGDHPLVHGEGEDQRGQELEGS